MDSIRKIDGDFYGGTRAFSQLEEFYLSHMECLEEWNASFSSGEDGLVELAFPKLKLFRINRCPSLRFKACSPPGRHVFIAVTKYYGHHGRTETTSVFPLLRPKCST